MYEYFYLNNYFYFFPNQNVPYCYSINFMLPQYSLLHLVIIFIVYDLLSEFFFNIFNYRINNSNYKYNNLILQNIHTRQTFFKLFPGDLIKFFISRRNTKIFLIGLLLFSWHGTELTFFFNHLQLNSWTINLTLTTLALYYLTITMCLGTIKNFTRVWMDDYIFLYSMFILQLITIFLFASLNLYTVVIIIELLSILLFLIAGLSFTLNKSLRKIYSYAKMINFFFTFFWINTLTSISLFFYIIIYKYNYLTWDFNAIINGNFFIKEISNNNLLSMFMIILIVSLKCGLPPFLIWKLFLFNSAPIIFLGFYIINYYPLIFIFFLSLISNLLINLTPGPVDVFSLVMFTVALITSTSVVFYTNNYNDLGFFFAVSSFLTSALVLAPYIILITMTFNNTLIIFFIIYYYVFYIFTNYILLHFCSLISNLTSEELTNNRKLNIYMLLFNSKFISKIYVFLGLISLASLPPTSTFLVKLYIISQLQISIFPPLLILFLIFLFLMLIFYFRNSKFLLLNNANANRLKIISLDSTSTIPINTPQSLPLSKHANLIKSKEPSCFKNIKLVPTLNQLGLKTFLVFSEETPAAIIFIFAHFVLINPIALQEMFLAILWFLL